MQNQGRKPDNDSSRSSSQVLPQGTFSGFPWCAHTYQSLTVICRIRSSQENGSICQWRQSPGRGLPESSKLSRPPPLLQRLLRNCKWWRLRLSGSILDGCIPHRLFPTSTISALCTSQAGLHKGTSHAKDSFSAWRAHSDPASDKLPGSLSNITFAPSPKKVCLLHPVTSFMLELSFPSSHSLIREPLQSSIASFSSFLTYASLSRAFHVSSLGLPHHLAQP